jgi:hypothetical protein
MFAIKYCGGSTTRGCGPSRYSFGPRSLQGTREFVDREVLSVAILAPPLVLGFEPSLGLSEQDELHDGLDTA